MYEIVNKILIVLVDLLLICELSNDHLIEGHR